MINERTEREEIQRRYNIAHSSNPYMQEDYIDLLEVIRILLKKWWIIVISALLCATGFLSYKMYTYKPSYTATAKMFVNANAFSISQTISVSQITTSASLVPVYSEILNTHFVLDKVGNRLTAYGYSGLDYYSLSSKVSCKELNETPVVAITVRDSDPDRAIAIANTIAKVLPDTIQMVIEGTSAVIIDEAVSSTKVNSSITRNTVMAAMLGAIVACGIIFLDDYVLNDCIMDSKWIEDTYEDIPVLGRVPDYESEKKSRKYGYVYGYGQTSKKKRKEK